jgi:hypothetical protein
VRAQEAITLSPDLDPWDRQPGETPLRYAQFCTYLELGRTRTLTAAAEKLDRNVVSVRQMAGTFHWRDRAFAKDAADDAVVRLALIDERIAAARDDAKILKALRRKIAEYINTVVWEALEPKDFLRLVDIVMRHGRLLFGDAAAILLGGEQSNGDDPWAAEVAQWSEMTPAARMERMKELTRAADARMFAVSGLDDE